ncbi:hypothetical protein Isop_3371 [Candidatus Vecturithrix granuli]|uniref:ATP-binding protein n=1 Tax=Vecturithrix granuli TaxID=1499967 RepID=A0A081BWU8_VECG1|nr:hypothetical protein Isop_3371 [Candidatus Vecturithrix granuli]
MTTLTAWHEHCAVRPEIMTGQLQLAEFAADLYGVKTGATPAVYKDPDMFFARTYPTHNMKKLVSDVLHRLTGKGGKPIITLQIAYGGGKTHTLIALLHLAEHGHRRQGAPLSEHPTVREFLNFAGLQTIPKTRVALLPFDKFDYWRGLEVSAPDGQTRVCQTPWGALAYQLGGEEGFAYVREHEAQYTPPAQTVIDNVLKLSARDGCATLILLDEAVMYCRTAVNQNRSRLGTLKDFFQVLTQAVAANPTCAMASSLIASQVEANDTTGAEVLNALQDVFQRLQELVEPVSEEDVAEVLRRRLFESLPDQQTIQCITDAMLSAYRHAFADVLREQHYDKRAAARMINAYPFHPDLLETLFGKWTQLHGFQKTRGALRFLALAIRAAHDQDPAPLIGPGALLAPTGAGLSAAMDEMVSVTEAGDKWLAILGGELEKARACQTLAPGLQQREIEQAVIAAFIHSQPRGQKADHADLYALLIHPAVDASSLRDGLAKWRERSWFLKENEQYWQLSTVPNLNHIHLHKMEEISQTEVQTRLEDQVRKIKSLFECEAGVKKYPLPHSPADIEDAPFLHYVVLAPALSVEFGKAIPENVQLYFSSTSHAGNPRTYKNAIIALAAERAPLVGALNQLKSLMGWDAIMNDAKIWQELTDEQKGVMQKARKDEQREIEGALSRMYAAVVAVNEEGLVESKKLPAGPETHFERIKQLLHSEERLITTTLDPDLLLPASYFQIWAAGQTRKKVQELINAFAQFARLPRLLTPQVIYEAIERGVRDGLFAAYYTRPDGSGSAFWRAPLNLNETYKPEIEIAPVNTAVLDELAPELLLPGQLPGLWPEDGGALCVQTVQNYFDGQQAPRLRDQDVLLDALNDLLLKRRLYARAGETVYLNAVIPAEAFEPSLEFQPAPPRIACADLNPHALPDAWTEGKATFESVCNALNTRKGETIPDFLVREAIQDGQQAKMFDVTGAGEKLELYIPETFTLRGEDLGPQALPEIWQHHSNVSLKKIRETIEQRAGRGELPEEIFRRAVQDAIRKNIFAPASGNAVGEPFDQQKVKLPQTILYAEAALEIRHLHHLSDAVKALKQSAPEIEFKVTCSITAEGSKPSQDTLAKLNEILSQVDKKFQFE